jgi:hypothetical protein
MFFSVLLRDNVDVVFSVFIVAACISSLGEVANNERRLISGV